MDSRCSLRLRADTASQRRYAWKTGAFLGHGHGAAIGGEVEDCVVANEEAAKDCQDEASGRHQQQSEEQATALVPSPQLLGQAANPRQCVGERRWWGSHDCGGGTSSLPTAAGRRVPRRE